MRAVVFSEHSPSVEVYRIQDDAPLPAIAAGWVRVRVAFAALNRLDYYVRAGWSGLALTFPHIPCADFSGVIDEVGPAVEGWRVGQRVTANPLLWCGHCRPCLRGDHNRCVAGHILGEDVPGACAEFVTVPAVNLVALPDGYDLRKAAAAPLVYVTAWHSLATVGRIQAGERVLIVGAGGGVNTASIQIARLLGAEVFVIAATEEKAQAARALGAHWAHSRTHGEEWPRAVFAATGRQGIDAVVDNVGAATWQRSLRTLRSDGRLLTVGGSSGYEAQTPVNLLFRRHLSILGSTMGTQDDFLTVMGHLFAGRLDPVVDQVFSMEEFGVAMHRLETLQHFGKVLIEVAGEPSRAEDGWAEDGGLQATAGPSAAALSR